jgi:DegV family protein with EDD domain
MAQKVGFVVDSTADFPIGMAKGLKLHLIPIHIFVEGNEYLHGVTISNKEVIDHMKNKIEVKTAPPVPSEYSDVYERLIVDEKYDKIISFHVSDDLSNCYKSAKNSLNLLDDQISKNIKIIDTKNATVGQALIVKKAVEIANKYYIFDTLEDNISKYIKHCTMLFTVDSLYWLKRAGKTNIFSAFIGSSLDIKPIVGLKDGELFQQEKHIGIKTAIEEMANIAAKSLEKHKKISNIWIAHADATGNAIYLQEKLNEMIKSPIDDFQIVDMGPTISAHTGPGAVCMAAMPDEL